MVTHQPKQPQSILPLESGDRLTCQEFERRYEAMPNIKKAELVEGVVYMASPVRSSSHGQPHAAMIGWLFTYCSATPETSLDDNTTVRLDAENELQPDACLRLGESVGGQSRLSEDDYIEGAPELIVEIAASSATYDLHDKKRAYRRNRVQEYIVWQVLERKIDWFSLQNGEYVSLLVDERGIVRSKVFPGLWLAVTALLSREIAQVLAVLQEGLSSPAHQRFVKQLRKQLL